MGDVKAVLCKVGEPPRVTRLGTDLASMQAMVGGNVEHVHLGHGLDLMCNEDGIALRLPFNRDVQKHLGGIVWTTLPVRGDFYLCVQGGEVSMSDADIEEAMDMVLK